MPDEEVHREFETLAISTNIKRILLSDYCHGVLRQEFGIKHSL